MTVSIRAREPEQKADRRRAILDAALRLWQESTYEQFTMSELANRLGVAKGTLYLYFETKEDLFQSLLDSMVTGWANELSMWLGALRSPARPKEIVAVIGRSLKGRPQMLRLIPVLEIQSGREEERPIVAERPRPELETAARALNSALPQLKVAYGLRFLNSLYGLMVGWHARAERPQPVAVEFSPGKAGHTCDDEFLVTVEALLEGFLKLSRVGHASQGGGKRVPNP